MIKFLLSKHSRSVFIFALLSLFMCMVAGKASAAGFNPVVKIDKTSYTSSGTEVTLRLWMFNWKYAVLSSKQYNARFTGDVYLYIDDKEVGKLNSMWGLISGSSYTFFKDEPGTVGNSSGINLDGTSIGTAQFQDFKSGQTYPYNSNTTDESWSTVDLKLSFNKSFTYYGHKITVKGKWQDQSRGSVVEKDVALDNTINGFVRPVNLSAQPSGDNMVFSWKQQGYNNNASTLGKWIVYKREGDNNVKLGEVAANEHSLSIEKKQYSCSNGYIMTFLPNICEREETVCGLTTSLAATGHKPNVDDICQICGHSFFRYHTSDGNMVDISNKDFGANVVSHEVVNSECVIEFDAPITKIPAQAFAKSKIKGSLTIPNSVTIIGAEAFAHCTELKGSLTLSNSLKTIGNGAFYNCNSLNGSLTIPNTVTTIGIAAFGLCTGFNGSLTIPNSVTTIGSSAFSSCQGFKGDLTIPSSIKTIEAYTFSGCFGFNGNLTIPNTVTTIGNQAFLRCSGFKGDLTIPNSVTTIGESAFQQCTGFKGNLKLSNSVKTIGNSAFARCTGFTGDLILPNSITTIGGNAFNGCTGFTGDLTIPNSITTIEASVFFGCSGFKGNLTLPNSITTIKYNAFRGCTGFTGKLILPNSITTIEDMAFYGCSGFTGNLTLPKSLEVVSYISFYKCNNIQTFKFQSLPEVIKGSLNDYKPIVSLSDDSYISPKATGTVDAISYTRQMSNDWGTLVLPYPLKLTGSEPYRLYKIETVTVNELVLKQLDGEVGAGIPYVVKRKGSEAELTFGNNNAALNTAYTLSKRVGNMYFSGTYWTEDVNSGYVISKNSFWNVEELKGLSSVNGVKVRPFRAWLDGTSANAPAQLSMRIDGSTTGINASEALDALNDAEAEYYDLSGKRLDEPQRGVNIVRMKSGKTKKIIIK